MEERRGYGKWEYSHQAGGISEQEQIEAITAELTHSMKRHGEDVEKFVFKQSTLADETGKRICVTAYLKELVM